ncbi:MAG: peptide ABC transporter permease [Candidatus Cloacimonadota bacterium]|nr:MAG: peptide ABC transporter permease [Candidatus Cloacimonadota bacterium]
MENKDILLIIIVIFLNDNIRLGAKNGFLKFFENLPAIFVFVVVNFIKLPWLIKGLYDSIKDYFTSPVFQKRAQKFKQLRRGYISLLIIVWGYGLSFFLPLFVNNKAWMVEFEGKTYYPIVYELPKILPGYDMGQSIPILKDLIKLFPKRVYYNNQFGLEGETPVNFRKLQNKFIRDGGKNKVTMPFYPYNATESTMDEYKDESPPTAPDSIHYFGTDDRGRDVFARLFYGFNISMSFALLVTFFSYFIGVSIGGYLGYFGGFFDIVVQRFVEIWSAIPFLYAIMIVASILEPSMLLLVFLLSAFQWMGMTYYIRGEFLREKSKDYVSAAVSIGVKDTVIIFRHILPNALTPVISFLPFAIVGNISALVSLDFLGFGLPAPTPSWGELMGQATSHLNDPWLVFAPIGALFVTLMLVSFIGEAVREAFDPKQYSRLR